MNSPALAADLAHGIQLAADFWDDRTSDPLGPERKLWACVIMQAIKDLRGLRAGSKTSNASVYCQRAVSWVMSDSQEPSSFRWALQAAGWEEEFWVEHVRKLVGEVAG